MKKYLRVTCTNCNKTTEQQNNATYALPDLCTITPGCTGRLIPIDTQAERSVVTPTIVRKETPPITTIDTADVPSVRIVNAYGDGVSLLTGTRGQIVLCTEVNPGMDAPYEIDVLFYAVDDEPTSFMSYLYRFDAPFSVVVGKESGIEGKNLRYNVNTGLPDMVDVKINGVTVQQGLGAKDYQLFDGGNDVIPNSIKFNDVVIPDGIAQVDVIVTRFAERKPITIKFRKQEEYIDSRAGTGAYENVEKVKRHINGVAVEYVLYCADLDETGLPLNTVFAPNQKQNVKEIKFDTAFFLIATKPYTHIDREGTLIIEFNNLSMSSGNNIKYMLERQLKKNSLTVPPTALTPVYPPLHFELFALDKPMHRSLGDKEQTVLDNEIIVGPKP